VNKKIVISIFVIMILSFYMVSLFFLTSEKIKMDYNLTAESDSTFELKIPYPYFPHKEKTQDVKINQSDHGKVYELKGNNFFSLNISSEKISILFNYFPNNYFHLSTQDAESGNFLKVWLFSDENVSISFLIIFHKSYPNSGQRIKLNFTGNINPGWNLLTMTKSVRFSDGGMGCICFSFNIVISIISVIYVYCVIKKR